MTSLQSARIMSLSLRLAPDGVRKALGLRHARAQR